MQMQMMNSPQIAFLKSNQGVNIQQLQLNALYNQFGFQNNFIPISKLPFLNQNNQTSQNAPIPQKSKSVETNQQNKKTSPAF